MPFFSRSSRQTTPEVVSPPPLSESPEQVEAQPSQGSQEETSPSSPRAVSKSDSDGYYPSFLPRRPPAPAPASTMTSVVGVPEPGPSTGEHGNYGFGGRKPTPRSVRIVSVDSYGAERTTRQEPTDQTKVGSPSPRAFSKATGAAFPPNVFGDHLSRIPQPRFRARGLHLELLRSPSPLSWLHFILWPFIVLAHIPVQTFFDFNAVFVMLQVAKYPNPQAPGVPGSGKNWILGTVAYIACWFFWIFGVFIGYELVYSFARRWRVKRPLMVPIYTSTPAFNYSCMSSYTKFCFLQHIRKSAWNEDRGGIKDGIAETCWWYSQNLPTVALLLPRAGLCLAILLQFTTPQAGSAALGASNLTHRDSTYFRRADGTLTNYAFGILAANAAWTLWRVLVLFTSWIGLWILSGQGCAGLCGPRDRWEEDEGEKTLSYYTDNLSDLDAIPWSWRECTRMRVQDAYDLCCTHRRSSSGKDISDASAFMSPAGPLGGSRIESGHFEGMEQLLAAVGLPTSPAPARRGVLRDDLFRPSMENPRTDTPPELASIIPKVIHETSVELAKHPNAPLMRLPYPFTMPSARASSEDNRVPFPPSPGHSSEHVTSADGHTHDEELMELELSEEFEVEPSSGRASGSMSSLGHPVSSRYPFQFRRPARGASISSGAPSRITPSSNAKSVQSRVSQATQSTGNRESTDSHSPRSHYTSSSMDAGIPMPPRHPNPSQNRGRQRAGTVPQSPSISSSSGHGHGPVAFPTQYGGRPSIGTTTTAAMSSSEALPIPEGPDELEFSFEMEDEPPQMMEQPDAASDDSHEVAEREDQVALLAPSTSVSPKSSRSGLRQRASTLSFGQRRRHGSGSASNSSSSRSRTGSSASGGVRSRTQSLIHSVGAASRSSLELVQTAVRSRAQSSVARLSDEGTRASSDGKTHSRSGSSSDPENHTFGVPLIRTQPRVEEEPEPSSASPRGSPSLPSAIPGAPESGPPASHTFGVPLRTQPRVEEESEPSSASPRGSPSLPSATPGAPESGPPSVLETPASEAVSFVSARETLEIPTRPDFFRRSTADSGADYVSTARASMVTDDATMEGTSSSGRTASLWEHSRHIPEHSGREPA